MQLTVKLAPSVAEALRSGTRAASTPLPDIAELQQTIRELGIELRPMYPEIDDPELSTWFTVQAPRERPITEVRNRLLSAPGVEGAFEPASPEPAGK